MVGLVPRRWSILAPTLVAALTAPACVPYGCDYVPAILADVEGTAWVTSGDSLPFVDRVSLGGSPPTFDGLRRAALSNQGEGELHVVWHAVRPTTSEIVTLALAFPFPLVAGETLQVERILPDGNPLRLPAPETGVRFPTYAWLDSGMPFLLMVEGTVVVDAVRPLRLALAVESRGDGGQRVRLAARAQLFEGRVPVRCPD